MFASPTNRSRFFISAVIALGLITTTSVRLWAQSKPILVVSIASIDDMINDVNSLATTVGMGDWGQFVTMMSKPYTDGVDTTQPLGVSVTAEDGKLQTILLIPVNDFPKFLTVAASQLGQPRDLGDGVQELTGPRPVFVTQQGSWACVASRAAELKHLPQDPATIFAGLNEKYTLTINARPTNLPPAERAKTMELIRKQVEQRIAKLETDQQKAIEEVGRQIGDDADPNLMADSAEHALRVKMLEAQVRRWETYLNEADQLTIGIELDGKSKELFLDVVQMAVPNTNLAKSMSLLEDSQTNFPSFATGSPPARLAVSSKISPEEVQNLFALLSPMRNAAKDEIDKDEDLPTDNARQAAKVLIDGVFDVAEQTVKSGRFDGGVTVTNEGAHPAIVAGMLVSESQRLEESLQELVKTALSDPRFEGVRMNVETFQGVRFHTMKIPTGGDLRRVLGEYLDVAVGFADDRIYFSVGDQPSARLKQAITAHAAGQAPTVPYTSQITLSLLAEMWQNAEPESPMCQALTSALANANGQDHITMETKSIPLGSQSRLVIEQGVLRAIADVAQSTRNGKQQK